jgi:hypothetical protein
MPENERSRPTPDARWGKPWGQIGIHDEKIAWIKVRAVP